MYNFHENFFKVERLDFRKNRSKTLTKTIQKFQLQQEICLLHQEKNSPTLSYFVEFWVNFGKNWAN